MFDLTFENILNPDIFNILDEFNTDPTDALIEMNEACANAYESLYQLASLESVIVVLEAAKKVKVAKKGIKPKKKLKKKKKITREGYEVEVEGDIDGIEGIDYDLVYEDPEIDNIVSMEGEIWDKFKSFIKEVWERIVNFVKTIGRAIASLFTGERDNKLKDKIKELEESNSSLNVTITEKEKILLSKEEELKKAKDEINNYIGKLDAAEKEIEKLKMLSNNSDMTKYVDELQAIETKIVNELNNGANITTLKNLFNEFDKRKEEYNRAESIRMEVNATNAKRLKFVNDAVKEYRKICDQIEQRMNKIQQTMQQVANSSGGSSSNNKIGKTLLSIGKSILTNVSNNICKPLKNLVSSSSNLISKIIGSNKVKNNANNSNNNNTQTKQTP